MRGRKIEPLPTGLWHKLRDKVDKHIPRAVQEAFYDHLNTFEAIGTIFIRPCDYGLIYLYWLLTGKSLTEIATPDCDLILHYFFANYFSNIIFLLDSRETIRIIIHHVLDKVKGFNSVHLQPRSHAKRVEVAQEKHDGPWKNVTLFIDGTHLRIKKRLWMTKEAWRDVSFYSYKLKKPAAVIVVSVHFLITHLQYNNSIRWAWQQMGMLNGSYPNRFLRDLTQTTSV